MDTLVVDKTGTLTEGKPRVITRGRRHRASTRATVLSLAASLERSSEHPLAAAIVAAAKERGLPLEDVDGLRLRHRQGRGRQGRRAHGVARQRQTDARSGHRPRRPGDAAPTNSGARARRRCSLAIDGKPGGVIAVADPIKATTPDGARDPAGRRHPDRHADRRQPDHRRSGRPQAGHRRGRGRGPAGGQEPQSSSACKAKGGWWRWRATA